jgi:hypothetical protein
MIAPFASFFLSAPFQKIANTIKIIEIYINFVKTFIDIFYKSANNIFPSANFLVQFGINFAAPDGSDT